jgi:hypothetical protein
MRNALVEELKDEADMAITEKSARLMRHAAREIENLSRENATLRWVVSGKKITKPNQSQRITS